MIRSFAAAIVFALFSACFMIQPLQPDFCPDTANYLAQGSGQPAPFPGPQPTPATVSLCNGVDNWTQYRCAICKDDAGALVLENNTTRCIQDTTPIPNVIHDPHIVVCVEGCSDDLCTQ